MAHYQFRKKLENKCEEYKCRYLEVNEYFTSKTCTNCGHIKEDLGSNKIYNCEICHITIDRDVNGARNILIKNAVEIVKKDDTHEMKILTAGMIIPAVDKITV